MRRMVSYIWKQYGCIWFMVRTFRTMHICMWQLLGQCNITLHGKMWCAWPKLVAFLLFTWKFSIWHAHCVQRTNLLQTDHWSIIRNVKLPLNTDIEQKKLTEFFIICNYLSEHVSAMKNVVSKMQFQYKSSNPKTFDHIFSFNWLILAYNLCVIH